MQPTVYHIPICPFCQRLEVLLELKGANDAVRFEVVDITVPRPEHILELTGGSTALPVMELEGGRSLRESLVLMSYIDDRFGEPQVRRRDPYEAAVENLLVTMEGDIVAAGYRLVMNQEEQARDGLIDTYLAGFSRIDEFLREHGSTQEPWLFDQFGWAEAVYTPLFQRFAFVEYYEGVVLPDRPEFRRARAWWEACVAHPAAQQTSDEEVIKLYYDYSRGAGNGALPAGRSRSSFVFEPHWRDRPMPPPAKYGRNASDDELGLV